MCDVAECDQPLLVPGPKRETKRCHCGTQPDDGRLREQWMRVVTRLQPVVRDAWRDVMHVVQADAACEPLKHRGEPQMRAAEQRRLHIVPLVMRRPVCILELMLHVEQPHAGDRRSEE